MYQYAVDFQQMRYGGVGTGEVVFGATSTLAGPGCTADEYAGVAGTIVLVTNSISCTTYDQALLAQQAGAVALLQYLASPGSLSNTRVRTTDWLPTDTNIIIPAFSVSYALGQSLRAAGTALRLSLSVNATLNIVPTYNIICNTGNAASSPNVVALGAHLDSVPEGRGINDNGSGSATLLEVALQYARLGLAGTAVNPVRFYWWGAEEIGLLGSRYHVRQRVGDGTISNIALYLNFDMLGSPNYVILVRAASPRPTRTQRQRGGRGLGRTHTGVEKEHFCTALLQ
jgi:hypothetical protein